jgi:hypothetical protein
MKTLQIYILESSPKNFWKSGHFKDIQKLFKYQVFANDTLDHNFN